MPWKLQLIRKQENRYRLDGNTRSLPIVRWRLLHWLLANAFLLAILCKCYNLIGWDIVLYHSLVGNGWKSSTKWWGVLVYLLIYRRKHFSAIAYSEKHIFIVINLMSYSKVLPEPQSLARKFAPGRLCTVLRCSRYVSTANTLHPCSPVQPLGAVSKTLVTYQAL